MTFLHTIFHFILCQLLTSNLFNFFVAASYFIYRVFLALYLTIFLTCILTPFLFFLSFYQPIFFWQLFGTLWLNHFVFCNHIISKTPKSLYISIIFYSFCLFRFYQFLTSVNFLNTLFLHSFKLIFCFWLFLIACLNNVLLV